jgi:hypothetical protein
MTEKRLAANASYAGCDRGLSDTEGSLFWKWHPRSEILEPIEHDLDRRSGGPS